MAAASPSSRPRSRAGSSGSLEAAFNARPPRPPSAKGRVRPSSSHAAGGAGPRGGGDLNDASSPPCSPPGWFPPAIPRSELAGGRATPRPPSAAPRPPSARASFAGCGPPAAAQRPTLNRYSVLPAIRGGRSTDDGDEGDADGSCNRLDAEAGIDALSLTGDEEPRPHSRPLYQQHQQQRDKESRSPVPSLPSSPALLLAVRLPSGERVERHFSPDETLSAVLAFALSRCGSDGQLGEDKAVAVGGCQRWVVGVGRARHTELSRSLRSCDVRDRTLLYVFLEEED